MGAYRSSNSFDPAARAGVDLDQLLDAESPITKAVQENIVPVSAELKKDRLIDTASNRLRSRVLFITSNQTALIAGDLEQQFYTNLASVFDEVHVLVLGGAAPTARDAIRLAPTVWLYQATARFFLRLPFAARTLAQHELTFTDGFRPDIIVARDPFESALAAYLISERFDRPMQVHVEDDAFADPKVFIQQNKINSWRLRFMRFVLRRALSVRAGTDRIKTLLAKQYPHIEDLVLLPRFSNSRALLKLPANLETKLFPQFSFTVLFVGALTPDSTLFRALDAVRNLLRTPSIGFVVIGEGSHTSHFKARAKLLGIEKQVLFLGKVDDPLPHIQSADVLLVTDTSTESEDLVIQAAALGTPMIMAITSIRADLFKDGESAFLCAAEDTMKFDERLRTFINTNALRNQFSENVRGVVATRIEDDPERYALAYRDTVEHVLFLADVPEVSDQTDAAAGQRATSTTNVVEVDGIPMKVPEDMKA